jgi:shikimate dehydrogenase
MKHALLVGLSGSGKSALGKIAAEKLGAPFVDLDTQVEGNMNMAISEIFERFGEGRFRDEESLALAKALEKPAHSVIATGGGIVLRPENVRAMREEGFVIFLDRPVEEIIRDIDCDGRPLLSDAGKLYEMERTRRTLYMEAARAILRVASDAGEAARELARLIGDMWRNQPKYLVIGDPIGHTLSPAIHSAIFEAIGVKTSYSALRVPRWELGSFAENARCSGLRGFNVTIPHKVNIIPLLDDVEEEARLCGAVNTVAIREGRLFGYNTDMRGLLEALEETGSGYSGRSVMILGAGGASRGIALKAAREGASRITIIARRVEAAEKIASGVREHAAGDVRTGAMTPETMKLEASRADVLINATPLGMSGADDDFESLDFLRAMRGGALVCDLVYKPPVTSLLRAAEELGLDNRNGLGMLIYQALLANEIFFGKELDKPALYKTVKERLAK